MPRKKKFSAGLAATLALAVGLVIGLPIGWFGRPAPRVAEPDQPAVTPAEVVAAAEGDGEFHPTMGWHNDPAAVAAVVQQEQIPRFSNTPAGRAVRAGAGKDTFLWDAQKKVLGSIIPPRNQKQVGSCVSFGTGSAVECLQCVQIARDLAANRAPSMVFAPVVQEVIYGGSRVDIGHGEIRGDGSVGAWAFQWMKKGGVPERKAYPQEDLTNYSESRCRKWGSSGPPAWIKAEAKKFLVKSAAQVKSAQECADAIEQGYPVAVCSILGYSMHRDKDGFCAQQGKWGHCTCIEGVRFSGGRKGFWIRNSWGVEPYSGPVGLGNPGAFGFWAEWNDVDRMLRENDSFAYSAFDGFPAQEIDWFAINDLPDRDLTRVNRATPFDALVRRTTTPTFATGDEYGLGF